MSKFILKNGSGSLCCKGCGRQDNKLNTYDWMADIPGNSEEHEFAKCKSVCQLTECIYVDKI